MADSRIGSLPCERGIFTSMSQTEIEFAASDVAPWTPVDGGFDVYGATQEGLEITVEIRGDEITGAYTR